MSRTLKWRLIIGFVLVFLAGGATGMFAGAWHARHAFAGRHGGMMGERMRERIQRQLDLTPEQTREMNPIFDDMAARMQEIRRDSGRRVYEAMEDAHRRLAQHLTPEQLAKAEKMKQRHMHRLHRRSGGEGRPPSSDE